MALRTTTAAPRGCRAQVLRRLAALAAMATATAAWGAGGHHAVDDAAILDEGACKVESWIARGGGERLLHAGAGCRLGPVELSAGADYARAGGSSATGYGLAAKWASELAPGVAVGVLLAPGWQARVRPRYQGSTVLALATWAPRDDLSLHFNLGRDFLHRADDEARYGASVEWAPQADWTLVLERFRAEQTHFVRAGVRWAFREGWSIDLSRAQRLSGPGASDWTLGATWEFPR
jgi:hypothetical protein